MKIKLYKYNGFSILAVILVIVAIIVAIGIWALSGQSNTSNTSNNSMDLAVEGLINDSANLKDTVESYVINGGVINSIDYTNSGYSYEQTKVNPKLLKSNPTVYEGIFVINPSNFYGLNVGDNASTDTALLVGGINDSACKNINSKLNGTTNIPVITNFNDSSSAVKTITGVKNYNYNYFYLGSIAEINGWTGGCLSVKNIADNNIYFFILHAQ